MKNNCFTILFLIFLTSCSNAFKTSDDSSKGTLKSDESSSLNSVTNTKTKKIESLLPNAFSNDGFDKEIRCDSFLIIGNGFYKQETNIMTTNTPSFYNYLKSI
ncbi:MAG: hypothetical protein J5666_02270, partial [Bacilli bacterium]|nr:hypothetical protein [Bacilli bacterium]